MENDNEKKVSDFPQRFENDTPMQLIREIENEIRKGNVDNLCVVTHKKLEGGACATRWGSNNTEFENKAAMASFLFYSVMRE